MNVWLFHDSGTAYNHTQWCEDMETGDILVIPSENVVGLLLEAWSISISALPSDKESALHYIEPGTYWDWGCIYSTLDGGSYNLLPNYLRAQEIKDNLPNLPEDIRRDFYYGD